MNQQMTHTFTAAQDLSVAGAQYKAVKLDGTIASQAATAATAAVGILITKPQSGEFGTYAYVGVVKARFGGAVNSGAAIAVTTSGFLAAYTAAGSGGNVPIGRALVQVASGDIAECAVNFINGGLAI